MAEYIDRQAALEILTQYDRAHIKQKGKPILGIASMVVDIEDIPAADVRPVVRGRNICNTVDGHCEFKCSVCGVEISSVYGGDNDFGLDGGYFNFCPNCGADMRQTGDENV